MTGWGKPLSGRLPAWALSAVAALALSVQVEAATMAECEAGDPAARIVACDALYHPGRKGEALAAFRFSLYLFDNKDRQYAHVSEMIDKIERAQAAQWPLVV
jgi:hypothetical protein